MSAPFAGVSRRAYWVGTAVYVVLLLAIQSVMGFGIDKFKELWGERALDVTALSVAAVGAVGVAWIGSRLWGRSAIGERLWVGLGLLAYAALTLSARYPQERLHYLGYGLMAGLLYLGFARDGETAAGPPRARGYRWAPALPALLLGSLIGYADELLQILWPRRYFDWADVAMNVVAVALGILIAVPAWAAAVRRP